jgi:hypothetical protein
MGRVLKWLDFVAVAMTTSLALNLTIILYLARLNQRVTVTVNEFGELGIELVLFPVAVILGLFTMFRILTKLAKTSDRSKDL